MKLLLARQDHKEKGSASKHRAWNILGELVDATCVSSTCPAL